MKKDFLQKGFTLIELLVVIAIISMLSSVVLASLNTARAKSRDAIRIRDLTTLRTALELYASDNGGHYPINSCKSVGAPYCATVGDVPGVFVGTSPGCGSYDDPTISRGLDQLIAKGYIGKIPGDPKATASACYSYYAIPDDTNTYGISYKLRIFGTIETYDTQATRHPYRDWMGDVTLCSGAPNPLPANSLFRKSIAVASSPTTDAECI
jgi:prepilin-type N-terminal cleavage/methylation domain-containing protein